MTADHVQDRSSMLEAELDEIGRRRNASCGTLPRAAEGKEETLEQREAKLKQRQAKLGLAAICLSGGGIRSAAFSLGVLQALAAKRLLNHFDYISTVSGGGFIGGWLQMRLREERLHAVGNIEEAQKKLEGNDAEALGSLRSYTNYLAPEAGPFSTDTWTGLVLYLRNMLLNWMVFAPLFLLLALAPISYRTLIFNTSGSLTAAAIALAIAAGALGFAAYRGGRLIPSHATSAPGGFPSTSQVVWNVTMPSLVWAFVLPAAVDCGLTSINGRVWWWMQIAVPALYVAALLGGYSAAWLSREATSGDSRALYRANVLRWLLASLCAAALIWIGMRLIAPLHVTFNPDVPLPVLVDRETALTVLAPLYLVGVHLLQTTFYVAFRKEAVLAELDREWLARESAKALLAAMPWSAFATACLVLPPLLNFVGRGDWNHAWMTGVAAGTGLLGWITAWIGKRMRTRIESLLDKASQSSAFLLSTLPIVFIVCVFVVAGGVLQLLLGQIQLSLPDQMTMPWLPLLLQAVLAMLLCSLIVVFGRVNVNRFSLHGVYRNRLVRAFLGSARSTRYPDPFTGFDADDNPRLAALRTVLPGQRLFPIINMTLNITAGSNTAWTERKAAAFTATPLACGAAALRHPQQRREDAPQGAFVATCDYAGMESLGNPRGRDEGVTIGTMLTISGAAVSPSWGYHSSHLTAFLMTLFNVRLGAWLPNPATATARELQFAKPANSLRALVAEALGATTQESQAVYLSDGGHFENLGLYEALRRRCTRIVQIDASQDGECTFFDLGNALRKAEIDLGVTVRMRPTRIYPRSTIVAGKGSDAQGFAVGEIDYGCGHKGFLIYIKPSFLPSMPAGALAYGLSDPAFPHNSTTNQWFSESQFESYRSLGRWQMEQLTGGVAPGDGLETLFAKWS